MYTGYQKDRKLNVPGKGHATEAHSEILREYLKWILLYGMALHVEWKGKIGHSFVWFQAVWSYICNL